MPSDFGAFKTKLLKYFIKLHFLSPIKAFLNQMPVEKKIYYMYLKISISLDLFAVFQYSFICSFIHSFLQQILLDTNFIRHNTMCKENKVKTRIHRYVCAMSVVMTSGWRPSSIPCWPHLSVLQSIQSQGYSLISKCLAHSMHSELCTLSRVGLGSRTCILLVTMRIKI